MKPQTSILAITLAAFVSNAFAAGSAHPVAAPVKSVFRLPLAEILTAHPVLRDQVIHQLDLLPGLPTSAAADSVIQSAAAEAIVRGLLDRPEILSEHEAELRQVLGDHPALSLAASQPGRWKNYLGEGLAFQPDDAAGLRQAAVKLDAAFDGSVDGAKSDAVVLGAAESAAQSLPASWRLSEHQKIHRSPPGEEAEAMEMLSRELKGMDLPPVQERFIEEASDAPVVAWAGFPSVWKLAVFREGGRLAPGDMIYAFDPSWFIQLPDERGRNVNYVTRGLYFEADGRTPVLATFKYPRRVRYFGNLLTQGAFGTDSGIPLEHNHGAPMSSSAKLEKVTNEKLLTRLLMAQQGARVPATRAFLMPAHVFLKGGKIPGTERVKAEALPAGRAAVRRAVVGFLARYAGPEVVVKPSGAGFHSGEGVRFFERANVDAITDHVIALGRHPAMEPMGAVLLEQRLSPPPVYLRVGGEPNGGAFGYLDRKTVGVRVLSPAEIPQAQPYERKDYNQRVFVVMDGRGRPKVVPFTFFRAGAWGIPTSSQPKDPREAAAIVDFEVMRSAWSSQHAGLMATRAELDAFKRDFTNNGLKALRAIRAHEATLAREKGDPYQAATDMVGLDFMYQLEDGRLVSYIIEVNDHDSAGQHALDLFYPQNAGAHSRDWIKGMFRRARIDVRRNPS